MKSFACHVLINKEGCNPSPTEINGNVSAELTSLHYFPDGHCHIQPETCTGTQSVSKLKPSLKPLLVPLPSWTHPFARPATPSALDSLLLLSPSPHATWRLPSHCQRLGLLQQHQLGSTSLPTGPAYKLGTFATPTIRTETAALAVREHRIRL